MRVADSSLETHDVLNQSPLFENINLFATDRPLQKAVEREGAGNASDALNRFGGELGRAELFELGRQANEHLPKLKRFDQKGRRLDLVEFHPAYHALMARSFREGLHCSSWDHLANGQMAESGGHVARAARLYMISQVEPGHMCPTTMTHAAVATLQFAPALLATLLPKILSRDYDPAFRPFMEKKSITIGMGMTEKQGGTDVRANMTSATPAGGGSLYAIRGHKWFMSAPMCDAFLILAQAPGGLSCFFLPRFLDDGQKNNIRIERLKDKLGNRSNASSEVEFLDAQAGLIGEEGRGIATIIEMVTLTRLDCAVGSAGLMRLVLANALHHAKYRTVFQRKLVDQPLMAQVLSDLALDSEAATALSMRLAASFDRKDQPQEAAFRRLMTPIIKYWVCKCAPAFAYEAMECMGGNGFVEDGIAARAYREAPLNAIWEGSGNVMCLDILRVMQRDPEAVQAVLDAIEPVAQGEPRIADAVDGIKAMLAGTGLETQARSLAERMALLMASVLLRSHAPDEVAEPFIASRLAGGWRHTYGAGLKDANHRTILARAGETL